MFNVHFFLTESIDFFLIFLHYSLHLCPIIIHFKMSLFNINLNVLVMNFLVINTKKSSTKLLCI